MDQFDAEEAKLARDAGMVRVLRANSLFADEVAKWIIALPHGWTGTAEDIRRIWLRNGGFKPTHHNAWGGVIHGQVRRGILLKTGKRKHMIAHKSHSRSTDVYTRA